MENVSKDENVPYQRLYLTGLDPVPMAELLQETADCSGSSSEAEGHDERTLTRRCGTARPPRDRYSQHRLGTVPKQFMSRRRNDARPRIHGTICPFATHQAPTRAWRPSPRSSARPPGPPGPPSLGPSSSSSTALTEPSGHSPVRRHDAQRFHQRLAGSVHASRAHSLCYRRTNEQGATGSTRHAGPAPGSTVVDRQSTAPPGKARRAWRLRNKQIVQVAQKIGVRRRVGV